MKIVRGSRFKEGKGFYPKGKDLFILKNYLKQIFGK